MGVELRQLQLPEHSDQGRVTGADGRAYTRQGTRAKRSVADEMLKSGAPLVYGSGQFEWFAGTRLAARGPKCVRTLSTYVIATTPTTKQLAKHEMWNAGIWHADDGSSLVYLTGRC